MVASEKEETKPAAKRVLVADDDEDSLTALEGVLSDAGFDVVTARDGQEAVERLRGEGADLLILDVDMPGIDGFKVASEIRGDEDAAHMPIIFLSGRFKDIASQMKGLEVGGNDYLIKPVDPDMLVSRVRAMLRVKELHDELLASRDALLESQMHFRNLFDANSDAVIIRGISEDGLPGTFVEVNIAACEMLGYTREELLGLTPLDIMADPEATAEHEAVRNRILADGHALFETEMRAKNGEVVPIELSATLIEVGGRQAVLMVARDVTKRKRAEEVLSLSNELLKITTKHTEIVPLLGEFITCIRDHTGCAAVGIRILDDDGNIPYMAYEGFSEAFYRSESPLSIRSDECMCINVIKGTTDPSLPFYTDGGSFFMNGTTRFLATVSEEEKGRTRNVCNEVGYESVALIPIHWWGRIFGLVHLADTREDMVPREMVERLERAAVELGGVLERIRTEEALRESEERFRAIFEQAADAIVLVDASTGALVEFNDKAHENLGYTRKEFEKLKIPEFEVIESSKDVEEHIKKIIREGAGSFETKHQRKDGEIRDIQVTCRGLSIGGREFVQSIWRDITERKKAEEELKESERRFKTLVQNIPGIVYRCQNLPDWPMHYISDEVEKLVGYPASDFIDNAVRAFSDVIHPDDREMVYATVQEGVRKRRSYIIEYRVVHKDGSVKWVYEKGQGIFGEDDRFLWLDGAVFDVTERKKAEQKIANLARFPSENPNPVMRITADYTLLYVNPGTKVVFEECGCTIESTVKDKRWRKLVREALKTNQSVSEEFHYGSKVYSFLFTPVKEAGYVNVYGLDITERKRAEEELEKRMHELGERVKELTCLYTISQLSTRSDLSLDEFFQTSIDMVLQAWQYPEIACARIVLEGKVYATKRFRKSRWKQSADIKVSGKKAGFIEVRYLKKMPERYEGPFLKEERDLINAIAEFMGNFVERKRAEDEIKRRLWLERCIASVSSRFVGMFDMDGAIEATLSDISIISGASRAYLFLLRDDGAVMDNTHEWCAKGVSAQKDNLQGLPSDTFPWWMKKLRKKETIHIMDVSKLPKAARAEREILEAQDIRSLLVLPVHVGGGLAGFIGFDNVRVTGEWGEDDVALLRTCADTIGNALVCQRSEEELDAQERFSTTLLDAMHDGALLLGMDGTITYVNHGFCGMTGFDEEELVGTDPPYQFWPAEDVERYTALLSNLLSGKGVGRDLEQRFRRKDGGTIHVLMTPTEFVGPDGAPVGGLAVIKDITERKRAEEEMRRRLMRYRLEEGRVYLVREHAPALSKEAFGDLLKVNPRATVLSRTPEPEFRREVEGVYEFTWLAERRKAGALRPDVASVQRLLDGLRPRSAVLVDRLDYLVLKNGFPEVLSLVQRLREDAYLSGHTAILSLDPDSVDARELRLLEKETMPIERQDAGGLPEDLMGVLRYLYRQGRTGARPSYAEVGREFGISKPTTRKRIRGIVASGHVVERKRGRQKVLELTELGRRLFDR